MKKSKKILFIFILSIICLPVVQAQTGMYRSDWTSLRRHQVPEWLIEAKFGIYCHWGIQTLQYIPEYENLSNDERIKLFTAEKFDAGKWAELFETAGARFGGVIGWHGSDWKHWDSGLSDYNSVKMGPKIDIVGEVFKALRKRDIKTLVSFHSIGKSDWIDFARECIDKYNPDIFWVDASFGGTKGANHLKIMAGSKYTGENEKPVRVFPEKYQRDFITYFYNNPLKQNKEVAFIYKSYDIPPNVGIRDLENGMLPGMAYDVWMTDMDMNVPPDWETHGWFYRKSTPLRSANELIDILMDVISKNGILLLNVPPLADGSFPDEVVATLSEVGNWLSKNGEAVYGTSPWFMYGEGPSEIPEGNYSYHHNNHFAKIQFTKNDIRFTVKGNNLYATCLGNPGNKLIIRSLNTSFKLNKNDILGITHLGSGKKVPFIHSETGLELDLDGIEPDDKANSFKIELNFDY